MEEMNSIANSSDVFESRDTSNNWILKVEGGGGGGAVTRGGFIPALEIFLNPSTLAGQLTGRFRNHPFCQGRQLDVWDCPKKSPKF